MRSDANDRNMPGIELLRFIAALSILILHYQNFVLDGPQNAATVAATLPRLPFYSVLNVAFEYGFRAVQLFWIISGFVMMRRYGAAIQSGAISAATFGWRRFTRLYPLHFLTLLAVAALQAIYTHRYGAPFTHANPTAGTFVAHLLMMSNWFVGQPLAYDWPIWSVSVEIIIYALFFWALSPCTIKGLQSTAVRLTVVGVALGVLTGVVSLLIPPVVVCAILFSGGCGLALLAERRTLVRPVLIALAIVYVVVDDPGAPLALLVAAAFAILAAPYLHLFVPARLLAAAGRLGDLTYASYLLHLPVQIAMVLALYGAGFDHETFLAPSVFLAYLAITLVASYATWRFFEMPAQRWLREHVRIVARRNDIHISSGLVERPAFETVPGH